MLEESIDVTQYLAKDVNMFRKRNLPSHELGPQGQPQGSIQMITSDISIIVYLQFLLGNRHCQIRVIPVCL